MRKMSSFFLKAAPWSLCASSSSIGETVLHRLLATAAGSLDEPTDGERAGATSGDLDRHLVAGATDAAGLDLDVRRDRLERCLERLDRLLAALLCQRVERAVDDALGRALLAVEHDLVDQLLDETVVVDTVGLNFTDLCGVTAWHAGS